MTTTDFGPGLSEREARRFYDAYGRKLDWSRAFEGKASDAALARVLAEPGQRVLELGTGCGHLLGPVGDRVGSGGLAVGIDLSATMLDLSRAQGAGACLVRGSVARLPFASASFDWVLSCYVLDLLPGEVIAGALAEAARVLRPGGRLVLCGLTEGETALERTFMFLWKRIQRISPASVGGCRPLVLGPLLGAAGLEVLDDVHVGQLGTPSQVVEARKPLS